LVAVMLSVLKYVQNCLVSHLLILFSFYLNHKCGEILSTYEDI
jgi:hypothetical protein